MNVVFTAEEFEAIQQGLQRLQESVDRTRESTARQTATLDTLIAEVAKLNTDPAVAAQLDAMRATLAA